jgi:uncharacterized phage-associated protein
MVDSIEFAKYIICRVAILNKPIRPQAPFIKLGETKLQKLLYICDGYILAANINFIEEQAKAWNYGPVYPRVHIWLKENPNAFTSPIKCKQETLKEIEKINAGPLVDKVIESYGYQTAAQLSAWSHSPGSPWEKALERGKGIMNTPIKKGDMKDYFKGILGENN